MPGITLLGRPLPRQPLEALLPVLVGDVYGWSYSYFKRYRHPRHESSCGDDGGLAAQCVWHSGVSRVSGELFHLGAMVRGDSVGKISHDSGIRGGRVDRAIGCEGLARQLDAFALHVRLAAVRGLPLIIHCRLGGEDELLRTLV